jgi:hypothetical protein
MLLDSATRHFYPEQFRAVQCCHVLPSNQGKWVVWETLWGWPHLWVRSFTTWSDWNREQMNRTTHHITSVFLYSVHLIVFHTSFTRQWTHYNTEVSKTTNPHSILTTCFPTKNVETEWLALLFSSLQYKMGLYTEETSCMKPVLCNKIHPNNLYWETQEKFEVHAVVNMMIYFSRMRSRVDS